MNNKLGGDDPRTLYFDHESPVKVITHIEQQTTAKGKKYRLELETPEGPAFFTYEEFIRWAQTITALLRPSVLLED